MTRLSMHSKGEDLIDVVNELNERLEHLESIIKKDAGAREKYPAVKNAHERYVFVRNMCAEKEDVK